MDEIALHRIRYWGGRFDLPHWTLLKVTGQDRGPFLQGQTTNDLNKITLHCAQLSARINRQGRVQGFFYLAKKEDHHLILIPSEIASSLRDDFNRFIITEDVSIEELTSKVRVAIGPENRTWAKTFSDELEYFHLPFYAEESVAFWGHNIDCLNHILGEIILEERETLRTLSGWPEWNLNVSLGTLINGTPLNSLAVSYDKGCFLGKETISKIHTRRGAATAPMLLEVENVKSFGSLVREEFSIKGKKAGQVSSFCSYQGKIFMEAQLARPYRVVGERFTLKFFNADIQVQIQVHSFPFFKDLTPSGKAEALFHHGVALFQKDEEEKAQETLAQVIKINPLFADAYESLGVIYGRQEKYDEAIVLMDELLRVDPHSIMAHTNKSLFYMRLGKIELAEKEKSLATINSFKRKGAELKSLQAKDLLEKRQREKQREENARREKMFRQVLELDPEDATANYGLGKITLEQGGYDKATSYFKKVIQVDAKFSVAYLGLGKTLEHLQHISQARAIYRQGIEVATHKGDFMLANEMQARLTELGPISIS